MLEVLLSFLVRFPSIFDVSKDLLIFDSSLSSFDLFSLSPCYLNIFSMLLDLSLSLFFSKTMSLSCHTLSHMSSTTISFSLTGRLIAVTLLPTTLFPFLSTPYCLDSSITLPKMTSSLHHILFSMFSISISLSLTS